MKNTMIAIYENEKTTSYNVIIDCDIATGKAYIYNPEDGYRVVTPYKDRNPFETKRINEYPYPWMIEFDTSKVKIPENWMD